MVVDVVVSVGRSVDSKWRLKVAKTALVILEREREDLERGVGFFARSIRIHQSGEGKRTESEGPCNRRESR